MNAPTQGQERTYTVAYAQASIDGLGSPWGMREALEQSWHGGATISRSGRRWYLSRALEQGGAYWYGRIGFVRRGVVPTVVFDPHTEDFIRGEATSGVTVPFVISTQTGLIAFQLRPDDVRERSFTGALRDLLNSGAPFVQWQIEPLVENSPYEAWIASAGRVTEFHFKLERPNPHYHDNDFAKKIIEEIHLKYAVLTGVAQEGEGVDTDSTAFRQALDHVLHGYGTASIFALDPQGGESLWVRTKTVIGAVTLRRRIRSTGGDEAPLPVLLDAFDQEPTEAVTLSLSDDDDRSPAT